MDANRLRLVLGTRAARCGQVGHRGRVPALLQHLVNGPQGEPHGPHPPAQQHEGIIHCTIQIISQEEDQPRSWLARICWSPLKMMLYSLEKGLSRHQAKPQSRRRALLEEKEHAAHT